MAKNHQREVRKITYKEVPGVVSVGLEPRNDRIRVPGRGFLQVHVAPSTPTIGVGPRWKALLRAGFLGLLGRGVVFVFFVMPIEWFLLEVIGFCEWFSRLWVVLILDLLDFKA